MKSKKLVLIIMTISFVLIIAGGVALFVVGLQADRKEVYNRIADVNNEFEEFSANTTIFENERDDLYNEVLTNMFYDTMKSQDKDVKERLSKYEKLVDIVTKNTKVLDKLCNNVYYPDSKVNTKCKNYKSIYEQVVNYFISDINVYNKNISDYNEEQTDDNNKLNKYKTNKVYIDYNNDKSYDGKEE